MMKDRKDKEPVVKKRRCISEEASVFSDIILIFIYPWIVFIVRFQLVCVCINVCEIFEFFRFRGLAH